MGPDDVGEADEEDIIEPDEVIVHMVFEQEGCILDMDMEAVMEPETGVGAPEATLLMDGRPDFEPLATRVDPGAGVGAAPLPPAGAPVLAGGAGCEGSAGLDATDVGGGGGGA